MNLLWTCNRDLCTDYMQQQLVWSGIKINIFRSLVTTCQGLLHSAYLKSSAASSALGLVAVGARFPPSGELDAADIGGWLPLMSLLTRSWIPTSWGFASTTAPIRSVLINIKTLKWLRMYTNIHLTKLNPEKIIRRLFILMYYQWVNTSE